MNDCESTLRLVLLAIAIFRDGDRSEKNLQRMLKDITCDVQYPKQMVKAEWMQSHGFILM